MPEYVYTTVDGRSTAAFAHAGERPPSITLDDGSVAHYDFAATAATINTQRPALDSQVDMAGHAVHPAQVVEYNQTAAALGLDARWNERGHCVTPSRSSLAKLEQAKSRAKQRASDPEFKPDPKNLKESKL